MTDLEYREIITRLRNIHSTIRILLIIQSSLFGFVLGFIVWESL